MVRGCVRDVHIETSLISQRTEDGVFKVLDVAAEFVLILGEEFGVAGRREIEDLSDHSADAGLPALDSQCSGLEEISR